jgi:hypothetical protein
MGQEEKSMSDIEKLIEQMDTSEERTAATALSYAIHRHGPNATDDDILASAKRFRNFLHENQPAEGPGLSFSCVLGDEILADHPYNPPAVSVTVRPSQDKRRLSVLVNETDGWSEAVYPNASSVIHMLDSLRCRYPADMQVSVFAQSEAAEEVLRWCRDVLPVDRVFAP